MSAGCQKGRALVAFRQELSVKLVQPGCLDSYRGAWTAIAMMLGEMEDASIFGDLQIEGQVFFMPVLPIYTEAEKVNVELPGFRFLEDAKDRRDRAKGH